MAQLGQMSCDEMYFHHATSDPQQMCERFGVEYLKT